MSPTEVVVDASCLVELLLGDERGEAVAESLSNVAVHAPSHAAYEVANVLRRSAAWSLVTSDFAAGAIADLLEYEIEYWPFHELAERAWDLRDNLTIYDASYVALAEQLDAILVTVDLRLARASGIRCEVFVP